jgi:uncharacterized protein with ACT and thioredoxin-like domain
MSFFYKVFIYFSRSSKKQFREEMKNSILRKVYGVRSTEISGGYQASAVLNWAISFLEKVAVRAGPFKPE